jgi:hypothetical protein
MANFRTQELRHRSINTGHAARIRTEMAITEDAVAPRI